MAKTFLQLQEAADLIKNETADGANTAARVGGTMRDIVDKMQSNNELNQTTGSSTTTAMSQAAVTKELTELGNNVFRSGSGGYLSWQAGKTYNDGDVVIDPDGQLVECIGGTTSTSEYDPGEWAATTVDEQSRKRDTKISNIANSSGYAICQTGGSTAAKTITVDGITEITDKLRLLVQMNFANTAGGSVTLNINKLGAKTLYYNGATVSATNTWETGEVVELYYANEAFQCFNAKGGSGNGGNIILEWDADVATTRKQVKTKDRKELLQISYKNGDGDVINEQYIGTSFTDAEWAKDSNWMKLAAQESIDSLTYEVFNTTSICGYEINKGINTDTGDIIDKANYSITDKIPLNGVKRIVYKGSATSPPSAPIAFYSEDDSYLGYKTTAQDPFGSDVPEGCSYGRFVFQTSFLSDAFVRVENGAYLWEYTQATIRNEEFDKKIKDVADDVISIDSKHTDYEYRLIGAIPLMNGENKVWTGTAWINISDGRVTYKYKLNGLQKVRIVGDTAIKEVYGCNSEPFSAEPQSVTRLSTLIDGEYVVEDYEWVAIVFLAIPSNPSLRILSLSDKANDVYNNFEQKARNSVIGDIELEGYGFQWTGNSIGISTAITSFELNVKDIDLITIKDEITPYGIFATQTQPSLGNISSVQKLDYNNISKTCDTSGSEWVLIEYWSKDKAKGSKLLVNNGKGLITPSNQAWNKYTYNSIGDSRTAGYMNNIQLNIKGTIGTDGTVTALPDSASGRDAYEVITAGRYGSLDAVVGDYIYYYNNRWVLIKGGISNDGWIWPHEDWNNNYPNIIAHYTGIQLANLSAPGASFCNRSYIGTPELNEKTMFKQALKLNPNADVVTVFGSVNDRVFGITTTSDEANSNKRDNPLDKYDVNTFYGAVRQTIKNIHLTAPKARIIFITENDTALDGGKSRKDIIEEVCAEYGIPTFNLSLNGQDPSKDIEYRPTKYQTRTDGLHESSFGQELTAKAIYGEIRKYLW